MRLPLLVAACVSLAAGPQSPAPAPVTAFVDVSVVPMDRERVLEHQTVVVRDGRVAAIGRAAVVPNGALRDRIASGELSGPRLVVASPSIDGRTVRTPADVVARVDDAKRAGYDLVKTHGMFPSGEAVLHDPRIRRAARDRGVRRRRPDAVRRARGRDAQPAEYLGRARDVGTVEVGKRADLILLAANPLADVRNVRGHRRAPRRRRSR